MMMHLPLTVDYAIFVEENFEMEDMDEMPRLLCTQSFTLFADQPRAAWSKVWQLKEELDGIVVVASC